MVFTAWLLNSLRARRVWPMIAALALCGMPATPRAGSAQAAGLRAAPVGGAPLVRRSGTTAALVVAARADVAPALLTVANRRALATAFHNVAQVGGVGRVVPVPVLLLGTSAVPSIRVALSTPCLLSIHAPTAALQAGHSAGCRLGAESLCSHAPG